MHFITSLKKNKAIYKIGHGLNVFRNRLSVIPYSFKYIFADRKRKLYINDKHSSEKYLIFQRIDFTGLMTHMLTVMGWIKYAQENGFTLIVDTSQGENKYRENNGENTWELFYKQPMIEDVVDQAYIDYVTKNKNFSYAHEYTRYGLTYVRHVPRWLTRAFKPQILFPKANDCVRDEQAQLYWEKIYKDFIKTKPEITQYIEDEYESIIKPNGKVLGVLVRGTGYRDVKPFMHHIQPEMSELIDKINEYKENYGWDYIYLATEEEKYELQLKTLYPGKILTNKRVYDEKESERHGHQAGLEYLSSMYLLSRCNMLIAGLCGGSQAAILMNQHKYEHLYVYDIGLYS